MRSAIEQFKASRSYQKGFRIALCIGIALTLSCSTHQYLSGQEGRALVNITLNIALIHRAGADLSPPLLPHIGALRRDHGLQTILINMTSYPTLSYWIAILPIICLAPFGKKAGLTGLLLVLIADQLRSFTRRWPSGTSSAAICWC